MESERCRYYWRNNWQTTLAAKGSLHSKFLGNQNKSFCFVGIYGWSATQPRSGSSFCGAFVELGTRAGLKTSAARVSKTGF